MMGKHTYKKAGAKPEEATSRRIKKRLKAANVPQAAIQRLTNGAATPDDLLVLQQTLGNEAVTDLLTQDGNGPGLASATVPGRPPKVQRQDPMDEEDNLSAIDPPEREEESGGIWGGIKSAWGWLKENIFGGGEQDKDQRTTPETGSEPYQLPPYYEPPPEEYGEWAEEDDFA